MHFLEVVNNKRADFVWRCIDKSGRSFMSFCILLRAGSRNGTRRSKLNVCCAVVVLNAVRISTSAENHSLVQFRPYDSITESKTWLPPALSINTCSCFDAGKRVGALATSKGDAISFCAALEGKKKKKSIPI